MKSFDTPILFLVFNRPDTTVKVFEKIREAQPKILFVAADGPRINHPDDIEKCDEVQRIINNGIDWECKVYKLYRENNLGCGKSVSGAISWFFDHVDEGIILEDDCLPDSSFFSFCATLLERYRDDQRIMHISGDNFQEGKKRGMGDYYYSAYSHIWGWATWKRAWDKYDFDTPLWPQFPKDKLLRKCNHDKNQVDFWVNIFTSVHKHRLDTWDYQWLLAIWINDGLCILPNYNLVINIGFGENATHTKEKSVLNEKATLSHLDTFKSPGLPIIVDKLADNFSFYHLFNPAAKKTNFINKVYSNPKFKKITGKNISTLKSLFTFNFSGDPIQDNNE